MIYKTLLAVSTMTTDNALNKQTIYELIQESVPLLCHPNLWIRHSLVAFIIAFTVQLSLAEVNCKLIPLIKIYLVRELHLLNEELLLDSLKAPIDRDLFDLIVYKSPLKQMEQLLDCLKEKKLLRSLPRHHQGANLNYNFSQSPLYQRITSYCQQNNVSQEDLEDQLLNLSDIIRRIAKNNSKNSMAAEESDDSRTGAIALQKKTRKLQKVRLNDDRTSFMKKNSSFNTLSELDDSNGILIAKEAISEEKQPALNECPPCAQDLNNLLNHKKDCYEMSVWSLCSDNSEIRKLGTVVSCHHRPKGVLIAHIHEHSKSVNRMIVIPNSSLFATCAADGLIKTWDCSKIESSKAPVNKAKQV